MIGRAGVFGILGAQRAQSTVELVAAAPIVLLCGMLSLQALTAGATFVYADNAAHAGALAKQLGRDPSAAAKAAIPGWSRGQVDVSVRGGRVAVDVRPRAIFAPLAGLLSVHSQAVSVSTSGGL